MHSLHAEPVRVAFFSLRVLGNPFEDRPNVRNGMFRRVCQWGFRIRSLAILGPLLLAHRPFGFADHYSYCL